MDERVPLDSAQKRRAVIGALAPMALAILEQTIVTPILPAVAKEMGGVYVAWLVTAYLVAATASTPLWGRLADARGRSGTLTTALALFTLGSIASAMAPGMTALIAGRVLQGLGGGGLIAVAQTLIADAVPPRERGRYVGYISAVWLSASVLGPALGAFAAAQGHWRAVFWVNLPLAAVAYLASRRAESVSARPLSPQKIDVLGALLAAAAITSFLLSLTWLGEQSDLAAVGALGLFVMLGVVFVRRSGVEADPLVPLSLLQSPIVRRGAATTFFAFAGHVGLATSTPFFLADRGLSLAFAGAALMALLVGAVVGANTSGRLMSRDPRYRRYGLGGLLAAVLASIWLASRAETASLLEIEIALFLAGVGAGAQNPITAVSAQNAAPPRDLGVMTALFAVARSLGGAFGAAAFVALAARWSMEDGSEAIRHAPAFYAAALCYLAAFVTLRSMEERPLRGG